MAFLQDYLNDGECGIYVFATTNFRNPNRKNKFKIGASKNLLKRTNQFFLCYPKGYYVYDIIVFKPQYKHRIYYYERLLQRQLKDKEIKTQARKNHTEWFSISLSQLRKEIGKYQREQSRKIERRMIKFKPKKIK